MMDIICIIVCLVISGILAKYAYDKNDVLVGIFACSSFLGGCVLLHDYRQNSIKEYAAENIPAIEVYRGNTTLKVAYIDSVAVDTLVIYKKDYEQD